MDTVITLVIEQCAAIHVHLQGKLNSIFSFDIVWFVGTGLSTSMKIELNSHNERANSGTEM